MKSKFQTMVCAALLTVATQIVNAQETATGIAFEHGTWEEATAKAKAENKLLFVDVWATWCGPCKKLASEVFTQKEVADFFNEHFVCYKLLLDEKDKALRDKNQELARAYNAMVLPALLWINAEGKAEHFCNGYKPAEEILAEARKALDPALRTSHITNDWQNQPHTLENGIIYFSANREATTDFDDFFLALTPEEQRDERIGVLLFSAMTLPVDSRALHYMAAHTEHHGIVESTLRRLLGAAPLGEEEALCARFAEYDLPFLPRLRDDIRCLKLFRFERVNEAFELGGKMVEEYADTPLEFVGNFVDVCFFIATKQHAQLTTEQKQTVLEWAKMYTDKMDNKNSYRKYFTLFEAYALNGQTEEAAQNMEQLKKIVGSRYKDAEERAQQLAFYNDLEASVREIK